MAAQRFILVNAKNRGAVIKVYRRVREQQSMNGTKTRLGRDVGHSTRTSSRSSPEVVKLINYP